MHSETIERPGPCNIDVLAVKSALEIVVKPTIKSTVVLKINWIPALMKTLVVLPVKATCNTPILYSLCVTSTPVTSLILWELIVNS